MIDYDFEHRNYDRMINNLTSEQLTKELKDESMRLWEFLSSKVILRDSIILNKYQIKVREISQNNQKEMKTKKYKEEQEQKEKLKE